MRTDALDDEPGSAPGLVCIFLAVELGGRQILGAVEGEFAVTPKRARGGSEPRQVWSQRWRKPVTFGLQNSSHVVHAWRIHAAGAEQAHERQFHGFLGLPDDIGPTLGVIQSVERDETGAGAAEMVRSEGSVPHYVATGCSVQ